MTLQTFRETEIPSSKWNYFGTTSNILLDADGEKATGIFQIPQTGTIDKVVFRLGTVTTSDVLRISLKEVDDTTGYPTTTDYGDSGSGVTSGTLTSNTTVTVDLGNPATATKGDIFAVVIEFNAYGGGNLNIKYSTKNTSNFPYVCTYASSSWTKVTYVFICGLVYDVGGVDTYYPMNEAILFNTEGNRSFHSSSTYNEYALRVKYPYPLNVTGYHSTVCPSNSSANFQVILYSDTTPLTTKTLDANQMINDGSGRQFIGYFNDSVQLSKDTEYRISIKPSTTNSVNLQYVTFSSTAQMGTWPGGSEFYGSYRNAGAWTNETTTRYMIGLITDKYDDGTGGASGGGLPIMAGSIVR